MASYSSVSDFSTMQKIIFLRLMTWGQLYSVGAEKLSQHKHKLTWYIEMKINAMLAFSDK